MRALTTIVAAGVLAATPLSAALAQPAYYVQTDWHDGYWREDPCIAAKHQAATQGAVTGGILGALAGAMIAGHGSRAGGAFVGGAVGAAAGSQIARSNVRCIAYPYGYRPHPHCHWVVENGRGFEICRGPDGYWRPWERGY